MATTAKQAVALLREMLNKAGSEVVTLKWSQFYEVIERERLSEDYIADVVKKAKEVSLLVCYGHAVVLVAKDYPFSPLK